MSDLPGDAAPVEPHDPAGDHGQRSDAPCPRCRALEARVAELERRLDGTGANDPAPAPAVAPGPRVVKALRAIAHGWGEGWALRPSPARRQWMTESPGAYQCLPMVVANQWGWLLPS